MEYFGDNKFVLKWYHYTRGDYFSSIDVIEIEYTNGEYKKYEFDRFRSMCFIESFQDYVYKYSPSVEFMSLMDSLRRQYFGLFSESTGDSHAQTPIPNTKA